MADVNVLMMGGRRAGKTSVLAALDECCDKALSQVDDITVFCTEGGSSLTDKVTELESYFTDSVFTDSQTFRPDQTPTDNPKSFDYEVRIGERESGYVLKFTDVPGEHYEKQEHHEDVQNMVNKSQVILIAIDTPHMMEKIDEATGVGEGHYTFNRVREITYFFKKAFQNNKDPRLVIFVPLKCEKYYYKGQLDKVSKMVEKGYAELLDILRSGEIRDLCTVAVMPICTLGGAEFFKFDGDIRNVGIYNFVRNTENRKYDPKFCEQPLFLILRYLVAVAEKAKKKQWTMIRLFNEVFRNVARMNDLIECKQTLTDLLKTDGDGYAILQDPANITEY